MSSRKIVYSELLVYSLRGTEFSGTVENREKFGNDMDGLSDCSFCNLGFGLFRVIWSSDFFGLFCVVEFRLTHIHEVDRLSTLSTLTLAHFPDHARKLSLSFC